jgi:hypothetical protein
MSRALTDAAVRNIQTPSTGRVEIRDPGCRGLELRITSTGAKTFAFRFRDRHSKRVERITIGRYPDVMLRDARLRADELRREIAAGRNPAVHKREAPARTFAALANRYLIEHSRRFNAPPIRMSATSAFTFCHAGADATMPALAAPTSSPWQRNLQLPASRSSLIECKHW